MDSFMGENNAVVVATSAILIVSSLCWLVWKDYNGKQKVRGNVIREGMEIKTIRQLRAVLPATQSGSCMEDAKKVISYLDDQMLEFIRESPLVMLATVNQDGIPFVSPKGDEPGFCQAVSKVNTETPNKTTSWLLLPDRPGNRLLFGCQNILQNPNVDLLFQIPGNPTTLRVGGMARLSADPTICKSLGARGRPATLVMEVAVRHAFFHCSKAFIRSQLYKPETWPKQRLGIDLGRYFSKEQKIQEKINQAINDRYDLVQQAVNGQINEPG